MRDGMRRLIERLLQANLSQIEYVVQHHEGRYSDIGHNERFICAGEAIAELQLRNKFYFAHLDTVEEGAADLDVGIKIFTGLNVSRGLPIPVLVHFHYCSRVPGARERSIIRCQRVKLAIESRYASLHAQGLLHCQMALSDQEGSERCTWIDTPISSVAHP
jgi:carboxysome shell carbonic anhydrase